MVITNQQTNTFASNKMNTQQINGYDSDGKFVIENNKYIEDPWTIIESYFNNHHLNRLVRHQLESYNNFVGYQIIKTIEMFNPVHIKSEEDFNETVDSFVADFAIGVGASQYHGGGFQSPCHLSKYNRIFEVVRDNEDIRFVGRNFR